MLDQPLLLLLAAVGVPFRGYGLGRCRKGLASLEHLALSVRHCSPPPGRQDGRELLLSQASVLPKVLLPQVSRPSQETDLQMPM